MDRPEVQTYRSAHPLAQVFPLLYDVLGRAAVDCDCVMAVGDADGTLLWVTGSPTVMRRAETIHFVEGAGWDEGHAGTNAPGMALHLDAATHVRSEEHFNRLVQPWTCAAAPIHDPSTQQILGLVDITGGPDVATPQSLALVRAAARMAESELARLQATGALWTPAAPGRRGSGDASLGPDPSAAFALRGLGQPELIAAHGGRTHRLSRRHGDILVALADHPDGLTAEQLEVLVYAGQVTSSTMRAEMTRLRSILGPEVLTSRPYRLIAGAQTDWHAVAAYLAAGRLRAAMQAYRGPLLPMSQSPAVVDQREILTGQVRSALIASAEADLMVAWTRSRWGADDLDMWERQAETLPAGSPLRPIAVAEAARLERELVAAPIVLGRQTRAYDNFIGGQWVPPVKGSTSRTSPRSPAKVFTEDRPLHRRGHRAGAGRRARRRRRLGPTTSAADARQRPAEDRRPHRGQPGLLATPRPGTTASRSARPERRHPAGRRPLPLLRRLPCARRRAASARSTRHHRLPLPRAAGRGRPDHPLELPDPDGGLEAGAGAGRRQLRGAQAGRADPMVDPGAHGTDRRPAAAGRAQRRQRLRPSRPASRWRPASASPRSPSPARPPPAG
jgi:hypothetical protein